MKTDTIAAVATALSESGISIIRISGEDAVLVADKIYRSPENKKRLSDFKSHMMHYGFIYESNADGDMLIDEVMVVVMKAPKSYTAEDTVEIQCHGGVLVTNRILETVLRAGARLADPGEFTKRAFLNGRIDLAEAEAVMDVISSKNRYALESSVSQLKGSVSNVIKELRDEIIYEIAFIESALDDPEHISLDGYQEKLGEKTNIIISRFKKLLDSADNGKILKEGINTVIVGKPNAGKSSLLNLLVGEERAIVTEIAGTTRDILQETIKLQGISLNIIDTAGIRKAEDTVEKIGVEKAKKYAADADLIIYVVDASIPLDESDYEIMEILKGKKAVILLNKVDLNEIVTEDELRKEVEKSLESDICMIKTSTKENTGVDVLEETVKKMFFHGELSFNDEVFLTNMRHKEAVLEAYESMLEVRKSLEDDMPEDFYSIDLMNCYACLGKIIGEEVEEDLVNEIFKKFCMGK